jgi:hypothetical protein
MNININRQFVLLDFELIDDPRFLEFVSSAEFGTYLILRRFIWRGGENKPHFLNLHNLYETDKLLVSSISNEKIASLLHLNDLTRVSKQLTKLEKYGVIKRIRTGRQNIYVLGEWYDYSEGKDGSKRLEWFYLEQKFGVSKSDLAQKAKSELHPHAGQTWPKEPDINIEENREENTVNGVVKGGEKSVLHKLPDLGDPPEKTEYIVKNIILKALGDEKSTRFYGLVAAKIPEQVIRETLSAVKADGARSPAKLFTYKIKQYALERARGEFSQRKKGLLHGM